MVRKAGRAGHAPRHAGSTPSSPIDRIRSPWENKPYGQQNASEPLAGFGRQADDPAGRTAPVAGRTAGLFHILRLRRGVAVDRGNGAGPVGDRLRDQPLAGTEPDRVTRTIALVVRCHPPDRPDLQGRRRQGDPRRRASRPRPQPRRPVGRPDAAGDGDARRRQDRHRASGRWLDRPGRCLRPSQTADGPGTPGEGRGWRLGARSHPPGRPWLAPAPEPRARRAAHGRAGRHGSASPGHGGPEVELEDRAVEPGWRGPLRDARDRRRIRPPGRRRARPLAERQGPGVARRRLDRRPRRTRPIRGRDAGRARVGAMGVVGRREGARVRRGGPRPGGRPPPVARRHRHPGIWPRPARAWTVRKLQLVCPVASLASSASIATGNPSESTDACAEGRVDLAALSKLAPNAMRLRKGLSLDRGSAHVRDAIEDRGWSPAGFGRGEGLRPGGPRRLAIVHLPRPGDVLGPRQPDRSGIQRPVARAEVGLLRLEGLGGPGTRDRIHRVARPGGHRGPVPRPDRFRRDYARRQGPDGGRVPPRREKFVGRYAVEFSA